MSSSWIFDQQHYDALNLARGETLRGLIPRLKEELGLRTAIDLGCGLGHFSEMLHNFGLDVLGVDGREQNVVEARRRYPHLNFQVADAQDPNPGSCGTFDLVFCFGLLYHLENPFRVIRSIAGMTAKLTMIEGIVYPSSEPAMVLMDENVGADQGLNYLAFYSSEACLVKMLRRSGLTECYLPNQLPNHPEYQRGPNGFRRRTVLLASQSKIECSALLPWSWPSPEFSPWSMVPLYPVKGILGRAYGAVDRLLRGRDSRRGQQ